MKTVKRKDYIWTKNGFYTEYFGATSFERYFI